MRKWERIYKERPYLVSRKNLFEKVKDYRKAGRTDREMSYSRVRKSRDVEKEEIMERNIEIRILRKERTRWRRERYEKVEI